MPVILADFDPGTLTGFFIVVIFSSLVAICLIAALVTYLLRQRENARGLLVAAGICALVGFGLVCVAVAFGRRFQLL